MGLVPPNWRRPYVFPTFLPFSLATSSPLPLWSLKDPLFWKILCVFKDYTYLSYTTWWCDLHMHREPSLWMDRQLLFEAASLLALASSFMAAEPWYRHGWFQTAYYSPLCFCRTRASTLVEDTKCSQNLLTFPLLHLFWHQLSGHPTEYTIPS